MIQVAINMMQYTLSKSTDSSRLFIVDDDTQLCELLEDYTKDCFNVFTFQSAITFLETTLSNQDIIILDLKMPDMDGIEVIRNLSRINKECAVILMSGYDESVLHSARQLAQEYGLNIITDLPKPLDLKLLKNLLLGLKTVDSSMLVIDEDINDIDKREFIESDLSAVKFIPSVKDLRKAIHKNQLTLFYQPQVNFNDGSLAGVEALVRWEHPTHGLICPDDFIYLAESSGLIEQLTEQVIHLAIKQSQEWQKQNLQIKISVNISAQNITSLALPEHLTHLVNESEIDPSMLMLEVTETELMTELTTSLDILTRLRLKGFKLSIDDFGTGYSSLSQLHRAPFTELKIDKSFSMTMVSNSESKAIVETCILLGHNLKMSVIAEGVENKEIWNLLKTMGCDKAQGYFLAKPLPITQFDQWLKEYIPIN